MKGRRYAILESSLSQGLKGKTTADEQLLYYSEWDVDVDVDVM